MQRTYYALLARFYYGGGNWSWERPSTARGHPQITNVYIEHDDVLKMEIRLGCMYLGFYDAMLACKSLSCCFLVGAKCCATCVVLFAFADILYLASLYCYFHSFIN